MRRTSYEWTYLYAAVDPARGESFFRAYLPNVDGPCFETSLKHLGGEVYPNYHLVVVLDNAPSHLSESIAHYENVSLLALPACSPELNRSRDGSKSSGGRSPTRHSRPLSY